MLEENWLSLGLVLLIASALGFLFSLTEPKIALTTREKGRNQHVRLLSALGLLLGSLVSLFGFLYYPPEQCFGVVGSSCPPPLWYYVLDYGSAAIALVSAVVLTLSLVKPSIPQGGTPN